MRVALNSFNFNIMPIKKTIKKVGQVAKAVATGYADYRKKNNAIHKEALDRVGAEQQQRISTVGQFGSPTPYGTDAFYGKAEETAKQIKKERGVSLRSSIRGKLGL